MLRFFKQFSATHSCWFMLLMVALCLEATGLYFQYELRFDPCVYCVYERAYIAVYALVGLILFILPNSGLLRFVGTLAMTVASGFGIWTVYEHFESVNTVGFGSSCRLSADFPALLKLDEWLPWMFAPTGGCTKLPWELFGLDMIKWLYVIFICGSLAGLLLFFAQFARLRRRRNDYFVRRYR